MRFLSLFVVVTALALAPSQATAQPQPPAEGESVLIVPFGVQDVGMIKLAAALTGATERLLTDHSLGTVQLAKAPRVDILTLIECPDGADSCMGGLAEALGVDRAVAGELDRGPNGNPVATLVSARGDGTFDRFAIPILGTTLAMQLDSYRRGLAPRLGIAAPAPVAALPAQTTRPTTRPTTSATATAPTAANAGPQPNALNSAQPTSALDARPLTPRPGPTDTSTRWNFGNVRAGAWIVGATGLVAAGFGAGFYAVSKSTENDIENAPTSTAEHIEALRDLESKGDRQRTLGGLLLISGAVATGAGLAWIFWDASRESQARGLVVAPVADADRVGAMVKGSF